MSEAPVDKGVYDCFVFRSDGTSDYITAWPGIYLFQPGAVWTIYLHQGEKQRLYDVFHGHADELTEWMADRGYGEIAMERRG